jgi:hypothetical protein
MIVVKLIGGLGNQMFQYAAGLSLANKKNTDLLLDTSFLNEDSKGAYTKRHFELDKFSIKEKIADKFILQQFNFTENQLLIKIKKSIPGIFKRIIFNEHQFNFHPTFFKFPTNTYLNGFWQSEKYFVENRAVLLNNFSLKDPLTAVAQEIENKIKSSTSVSLHIRRGDFLSLKSANHFHGFLPIEYYKQAIDFINSKVNNTTFFIFSDDIAWCKTHFDFINSKEFVDGKELGISTHEELILMSRCQHNITANSSFSWWGAWLNQNPNKLVIAPKNWFADKTINTNDLIPESWVRL